MCLTNPKDKHSWRLVTPLVPTGVNNLKNVLVQNWLKFRIVYQGKKVRIRHGATV